MTQPRSLSSVISPSWISKADPLVSSTSALPNSAHFLCAISEIFNWILAISPERRCSPSSSYVCWEYKTMEMCSGNGTNPTMLTEKVWVDI